jgi:hypothetical protein
MSKVRSVAELLGKRARVKVVPDRVIWPLPEQLMGIEVEVDRDPERLTVFAPTRGLSFWQAKNDGSLRNGIEYVLAQPYAGSYLDAAIKELFEGSKFFKTTTGSTHIHIDMLENDTSPNAIPMMVLVTYCFEEAIFAIAGGGRKVCGFCNPMTYLPDQALSAVLTMTEASYVDALRFFEGADEGQDRYYGVNLQALSRFGSIEFRHFPTATNEEELIGWVKLIQSFKKAAMSLQSVDELEQIIRNEDTYMQFIIKYFTEWADTFFRVVPRITALNAFYKAQTITNSYKQRIPNRAFNPEAITKNKALSRFLKVTKAKVDPVINELIPVFVLGSEPGQRVPPSNTPDLQMLINLTNSALKHVSDVYVNLDQVWTRVSSFEQVIPVTNILKPRHITQAAWDKFVLLIPRLEEAIVGAVDLFAGHTEAYNEALTWARQYSNLYRLTATPINVAAALNTADARPAARTGRPTPRIPIMEDNPVVWNTPTYLETPVTTTTRVVPNVRNR